MMNVFSSVLFVCSLWLAVLLGPQLTPWSWGASLLVLGLAVLAALPGLWRSGARSAGWWLGGIGFLVVGWFAARAWLSPVADYGLMDALLLAGAVGGFLVMRAMQDSVAAERVFLWGLWLLLLASVVVTARQVVDPTFTPGLVARFPQPSGFFGHYNYGANFLIGASCLLGGSALFGTCYRRFERVLWGCIALAGLVAVYFTGSRGGQLAAAVAAVMFVVMALICGKRRDAKWFAPGIIALPFLGIVVVAFLLNGWSRSQEIREADTGVDTLMDNTLRLHWLGIAVACVVEHPWQGGGSRSFSWECNQHWDVDAHGAGGYRPEQVHNEILQAATDYGIIGAGLLLVFCGSVVLAGTVRAIFERPAPLTHEDAWLTGGLAGLAGILAQSNFCFLFHVLPGALLLGICLGRLAFTVRREKQTALRVTVAGGSAVLIGVAAAALLLPMGWLGARVTAARLADGFGRVKEVPFEVRLRALDEAIRCWPLGELFLERANWRQSGGSLGAADRMAAIDDYRQAAKRRPFDPMPAVNLANLLSAEGEDAAAEAEFARAVRLQGGLETAYRGHYYFAAHYQQKAVRQFLAQDATQALASYELAVAEIEKATKESPIWVTGTALRTAIHEGRGVMLEGQGDWQRAMTAYDQAAKLMPGSRANYRAALLLARQAEAIWLERKPEAAMAGFLAAKKRFSQASEFPEEVSQVQRKAVWDYLHERIRGFEVAKIKPQE